MQTLPSTSAWRSPALRRLLLVVVITWLLPISASRSVTAGSAAIPSIPLHGWYEVPNSKLEALIMPSAGSGAKDDIMKAWSGGTFDTKRNRLLVHGGGGQGQQDNGIFAFSLETFQWTRVTPPNRYWNWPIERAQDTNPDGTPASIHSYGGLAYIPDPFDWFVRIGGARWHDDYSMSKIFAYSFPLGTWGQVGDASSSWLGFTSAYDKATGRVLFWDYLRVKAWRPGWKSAWPMSQESMFAVDDGINVVIDPDRRRLWLIGAGHVMSTGLDDKWPSRLETHKTSGDTAIVAGYAPGLAYDPHLKKIVAWMGWGGVFVLDPHTLVWTRMTPLTRPYPTHPTSWGVWGRFQYAPALNLYVAVDAVNRNVWLYRLTEGAGGPPAPADPPPPAAPPAGDLPPNTWVRRRLPTYDPAVYTDALPASPVGGIKHVRVRYNPDDKKLYVFGGDHSGGMGFWSDGARHEVYTYDVASDVWTKIHPRCLPTGAQPLSPDQVLVDYDTKRKMFWMLSDEILPGIKCVTSVSQPSDRVFSFDPTTDRYAETPRRSLSSIYPGWRGSVKNWVYDPLTDKLYAFGADAVFAYTIQSSGGGEWWNWINISEYPERTKLLGFGYLARGGRWIYTVDLYASRLYRWSIDARKLEDLGVMPFSTNNIEEEAHGLIAWNETAQRLMFVRGGRLWVYDPATKAWTQLPGNPDGIKPAGNNIVWDGANNALVVFGGLEPANPYIYLFRYAP